MVMLPRKESVDPDQEDTYLEGLLVNNWTQKTKTKQKPAQQPFSHRSLSCKPHLREKPTSTVFLPSDPALIKEFLESYFHQ